MMKNLKWETIIGLEVHAQLKTKTKIFCSCANQFGEAPNTLTCPVCLGLPGSLPVLNEKAKEGILFTGLALKCEIPKVSKFDRKNYYYPDLPKAYQISQYDQPFCRGGEIVFLLKGKETKVSLTRIHLEEDAGKLVHAQDDFSQASSSMADYNRAGTPLMEIVTEPEIKSPEEATAFLEALKNILLYLGVSDCNMEEGSLRCDANISIRPQGEKTLGVKTELKNMNSFSGVGKALHREIKRQIQTLESGGIIVQETRLWNEETGHTESMRGKEEANDYRYFPEPDLPPVEINEEYLKKLRQRLPELPLARKKRFQEKYNLPEYDAGVLTAQRRLADFFEETLTFDADPKKASNWIMTELMRKLNQKELSMSSCSFTPEFLAELLSLIASGEISGKIAKEVFDESFDKMISPREIVQKKGLKQISNQGELLEKIKDVIEKNPETVAEFKKGKKKAIGFLVGQVIKATKGQANPKIVNELFTKELEK